MCVTAQEPHPVRLSQEEVEKRKAQLDSCPLNMFEHLSELKSFFVEVCLKRKRVTSQLLLSSICLQNVSWILIPSPFILQGISDRVPLVKAVVPKNQSHSFITQGSPDTMVRLGASTYHR